MCGVYYLWDGERVIYIGASRKVEYRVARHRRTGKRFIAYFCDECEESKLLDNEAASIREFQPILNERNTLTSQLLDNSGHIKSDCKSLRINAPNFQRANL